MLWIQYIDGTPFRKLGDQQNYSGKQVFFKVDNEINNLPWNWQLTKQLCNSDLFSHILIIDGKYVAVKGFDQKIPFLYGLDYLSHDPVHGDLFTEESEAAFSQFFGKLKDIGYTPTVVVADDRQGLKQALRKVFPYAKLQLCHNHYIDNIRSDLNIRTQKTYHHFFNSLLLHVFAAKTEQEITDGLRHVFFNRTHHNRTLENIVTTIEFRRTDLFNFLQIQNCPNNTNLIELYNSHLNGRLKTIKGFQSFISAQRWCNAYLIRRRTKTLTDCDVPFKHLNGFASLQFTINDPKLWSTNIPGVKPPKKQPKR